MELNNIESYGSPRGYTLDFPCGCMISCGHDGKFVSHECGKCEGLQKKLDDLTKGL